LGIGSAANELVVIAKHAKAVAKTWINIRHLLEILY